MNSLGACSTCPDTPATHWAWSGQAFGLCATPWQEAFQAKIFKSRNCLSRRVGGGNAQNAALTILTKYIHKEFKIKLQKTEGQMLATVFVHQEQCKLISVRHLQSHSRPKIVKPNVYCLQFSVFSLSFVVLTSKFIKLRLFS